MKSVADATRPAQQKPVGGGREEGPGFFRAYCFAPLGSDDQKAARGALRVPVRRVAGRGAPKETLGTGGAPSSGRAFVLGGVTSKYRKQEYFFFSGRQIGVGTVTHTHTHTQKVRGRG